MNQKEVLEIRKRFRPDQNSITHVRGCYINEKKEIISEFNQSLGMMTEPECEKILAILKRTLSGTLERNLINIGFDINQVIHSEEHERLMTLRTSSLQDEPAMQSLYQQIIQTVAIDGNYLIFLAQDTFDVPYRSTDGDTQQDGGSEVFQYIICSICPIKPNKSSLSYYINEQAFHNQLAEQLISPPTLGFMFPAFDDRTSNIYGAMFYTRDISANHESFVDAVFKSEIPMPAAAQKELFESILGDALSNECSYEVVQTVHETLCDMIETHKANKEVEQLTISKSTVKNLLQACGVSDSNMTAFEEKYDNEFGADTDLNPRNIVDTKVLEIRTPNVKIQVSPEFSDLIETRIIDGVKYIVIRASDGIEVNGVNVLITQDHI